MANPSAERAWGPLLGRITEEGDPLPPKKGITAGDIAGAVALALLVVFVLIGLSKLPSGFLVEAPPAFRTGTAHGG